MSDISEKSSEILDITTLTPHIGAEIRGVDLSEPLGNDEFSALYQAWLDWKVLVFRDQHLDREQHKAFGRRFGSLHVHPMQHSYGGDPEILTVKTTAKSAYTAGDGWHTDVTCDEIPPLGSMLYVTETPEAGGGDTLYADMYLAYEMLSDTMKEMLEGLTAIHDGARPYLGSYKVPPPDAQSYPKHEHPVVVTHPETRRKLLYVNSGFTTRIKGLAAWESEMLLNGLTNFIATTPKLTCRVRWEPNTLVFWDNRCTQHHAVWDYYPHSRYGERVSIVGTERPAA
ncbi:MAG: taurine dioxygenase [Gammaproteobacteria bacterium]|nr:MAG: taurine dioxygenase [Gammaproteobacteria bacterium]